MKLPVRPMVCHSFNDAQLNQLVAQALKANASLRASATRTRILCHVQFQGPDFCPGYGERLVSRIGTGLEKAKPAPIVPRFALRDGVTGVIYGQKEN